MFRIQDPLIVLQRRLAGFAGLKPFILHQLYWNLPEGDSVNIGEDTGEKGT